MRTGSISLSAPVNLVAAWVAAFNQRDLEGMLACLDRDVTLRPLKLTGLDRSYRGHDGVRRWFEQLGQLGHEYRLDVDSIGSDAARSVVTAAGSLRLGEAPLAPFSAIYAVARGQILSARHYLSELDLIEHLGLVGEVNLIGAGARPEPRCRDGTRRHAT